MIELAHGYYLDESDPDILVLHAPDGRVRRNNAAREREHDGLERYLHEQRMSKIRGYRR